MPVDGWNERYRSGEKGPTGPAPILIDAVRLLAPARALDLACGAGRNALYLIQHGWSVTAVDGSPVAIEMLHAQDPRIETQILDLEREELPYPDGWFEMVCIIHFLHRPLFAEARRVTRPGGVVVAAIHTVRSTMNPLYTVALGELRSRFEDWEILIGREDHIAEVVARKPVI